MIKITGALTAAAGLSLFNNWSVPFFGVPLTVVTMAAIGAYVSFAWYGERPENKKGMYALAAFNTFLATISVAVIPLMMGLEWVTPKLEPPLAALVAVLARWGVPATIEIVPEVMRKIFRLPPKNDSEG